MKIRREHRKNSRKPCQVPIDAKRQSIFDQFCSVDISKGGVGFISKKPIALSAKIAIELEVDPNQGSALMMGKVVWVKPDQKRHHYRVGIKFTKVLFPSSKSRLNVFH